jgi:hypothetical protein
MSGRLAVATALRIVAPHFVAAAVLEDGTVTRAAPILSYMRGWPRERVVAYCEKRQWHWTEEPCDSMAAAGTSTLLWEERKL